MPRHRVLVTRCLAPRQAFAPSPARAADLSGESGTNTTQSGHENYNIDTRNTDPNRGPTSNNPAVYDDKDLFNLL